MDGVRTVRSFCRVCTSVCGILVDVQGDEVLHIKGDRDHPLSQGYTCPKGRALPRMHHHPDRIERPLMRVDGELRPSTWDECLDDLGTRVREIIDEHGPEAVGIFFGSGVGMDAAGYRMAQALHRAIGTPAKFSPMTIDGTAKVLISDLVGGSPALSPRPDYDNAAFVLLVGTNPVVSHGHSVGLPNPIGTIKSLRARADVWVIDPRHTETARLATAHLAPRPGTDYAILAHLVREVLKDGQAEHRVLDQEVVRGGQVEQRVTDKEALRDGRAEDRVIDQEVLRDSQAEHRVVDTNVLTDGRAEHRVLDQGVLRDGGAEDRVIDQEVLGGGQVEQRVLDQDVVRDGRAERRVLDQDVVTDDQAEDRVIDKDVLAAAVEPFTLQHAAQVADVPEADLIRLREAVRRAGRVAVDTGTGVTMASSGNVTQWLAWVLMILTGSMNRPGGAWFHPGFAHQLEARELPVSPPEGAFGPGPRSRPDAHSYLGEWPCAVLADEIHAGNIRAVLNLGGHLVTAFPDTSSLVPALKELDVFATIEIIGNETTALSTHVLPTKDQLERADVTLWDHMNIRVASQHTPPVVDPVGDRRSTWWVLAELGQRLGHELADTSNPSDDAMLATLTARARCTTDELIADGYVERDHELPAPWVERHLERLGGWRLAPRLLVEQLAALQAPAPLVLVPRRQKSQLNSQFGFLGETCEVFMHPDDAAEAGVCDSQALIIRSAQGELTGIARVDASVRRGAVSVPHGHQGVNVNLLTSNEDIDVTGMTRYSGIPVTVHPV